MTAEPVITSYTLITSVHSKQTPSTLPPPPAPGSPLPPQQDACPQRANIWGFWLEQQKRRIYHNKKLKASSTRLLHALANVAGRDFAETMGI